MVDGRGLPLLTDGARRMGVLLWVLIIGCVAGTVARVLMPGPNRPKGFVLTIVLGVAGRVPGDLPWSHTGHVPHGRKRRLHRSERRRCAYSLCLEPAGCGRGDPRSRSLGSASLPIRTIAKSARRQCRVSARGYIRGTRPAFPIPIPAMS